MPWRCARAISKDGDEKKGRKKIKIEAKQRKKKGNTDERERERERGTEYFAVRNERGKRACRVRR